MKRHHAAPLPLAVLALLLLAPPGRDTVAQTGSSPARPPGTNRVSPGARERSIREREMMMRQIEKDARRSPPPRDAALALAEIAEDFRRLQVVNNSMMGAVAGAPAPDYSLVAEATGEIRWRAERLRDNLKLPEGEAGRPPAPEAAETPAQLKEALFALDRSIMEFVGSPIFRNPGVMDAVAAAKASRDLTDLIERSRRAGKDATRLGKKRAAQ